MKHALVAIKDRVAMQFKPPMTYPNVAMAVREFADGINNTHKDNLMFKHPEDFDLYLLAEYDDETGLIQPIATPMQVAYGKEHHENRDRPQQN